MTAGPNEDLKKEATTWLAIAVVTSFFCMGCCLGLSGAVMSFLALQAADQGNLADAQAKLKWGKILTVAGVVLGALIASGWVLYTFVIDVASAT